VATHALASLFRDSVGAVEHALVVNTVVRIRRRARRWRRSRVVDRVGSGSGCILADGDVGTVRPSNERSRQ
jgi:hypothetical protein